MAACGEFQGPLKTCQCLKQYNKCRTVHPARATWAGEGRGRGHPMGSWQLQERKEEVAEEGPLSVGLWQGVPGTFGVAGERV